MLSGFLQILLNKFNNSIESQKPKVAQLEQDVETLNDDISTLKAKVETHAQTHMHRNAHTHKDARTHTHTYTNRHTQTHKYTICYV